MSLGNVVAKLLDLRMRIECQDSKALQLSSDTVFLDQKTFCFDLIDDLEAAQCNWIGKLDSGWEVDLNSCSLPNAMRHKSGFDTACLTIQELVSLIQKLPHKLVMTEQQRYWVYTVCLRVSGLGRVRLVFSFDNPQLTGSCTVLATNRLDWSPRKVIEQSLQRSQRECSADKPDGQAALSFDFVMPSYSAA
jgi:hypothetical protein